MYMTGHKWKREYWIGCDKGLPQDKVSEEVLMSLKQIRSDFPLTLFIWQIKNCVLMLSSFKKQAELITQE